MVALRRSSRIGQRHLGCFMFTLFFSSFFLFFYVYFFLFLLAYASLCIHAYIYVYIYVYLYVYKYISVVCRYMYTGSQVLPGRKHQCNRSTIVYRHIVCRCDSIVSLDMKMLGCSMEDQACLSSIPHIFELLFMHFISFRFFSSLLFFPFSIFFLFLLLSVCFKSSIYHKYAFIHSHALFPFKPIKKFISSI